MKVFCLLVLMISMNSFADTGIECLGGIIDKTSNAAVVDKRVEGDGKVVESDGYFFKVLPVSSGIFITLYRKVKYGSETIAYTSARNGTDASLFFHKTQQEQASLECKRIEIKK